MPVPTIASVTPNTGLSRGRRLVEILGTNFQLPPTPPLTGKTTPFNPSVEVLFGSRKGANVAVVSATRLLVVTPRGVPGPVNVTVRNIDQNGVLIGAETVTSNGAFTYALPDLTKESDLARLVRTLLQELKAQVLPEISITVHTDYDKTTGDTTNFIEVASLPSLVIIGPKLSENRFFSLNTHREKPAETGLFSQLREPYTVDLGFRIIGASESTVQLLNLMATTTLFFEANDFLEMPTDPALPLGEQVQYEMQIDPEGDFEVGAEGSNSNLRSFSGSFTIRGFDLDEEDMTALKGGVLVDPVVPPGVVDPNPNPVTLDIQLIPIP